MDEIKRLRVALYARVSKDEASSSGALQDPENQLVPLRKFCDAMNWELRDTFVDRASGGSANRPNFQIMLNRVKQRYYDIVLVWSLDRFSREGMTNTLKYVKTLRDYKTGLKSYQETWLDTTQEGVSELILAFMAWVAAEEKRKISERTKAGLARKKAEGKKLGRPVGWRKSKTDGINSPSYKELNIINRRNEKIEGV
jgi:DNA invertase Pin-like site-specific DNA recombinase